MEFADVTALVPGFRDESPAAIVWNTAVWLFWQSNRFGSSWQPTTAYAVGAYMLPASSNGWYYQCTRAGTSGTTAPAFTTASGATIADGKRCLDLCGDGDHRWPCRPLPHLVRHGEWDRVRSARRRTGAPLQRRPAGGGGGSCGRAPPLFRLAANRRAVRLAHRRHIDNTRDRPPTDRQRTRVDVDALLLLPHALHLRHALHHESAHAGAAPIYARNAVGIYLTPDAGTTSDATQQTTARVRALVVPFQPLPAGLIWYVKQSDGTYAPLFADVTRTLSSEASGP